MRTILKLNFIISVVILLFSCNSPDYMYKQYTIAGGRIYPQKPTKPIAYSGENKVVIKWDKGFDPSIVKAIVSWGNSDSAEEMAKSREFPINGNSQDVEVVVDNLLEQNYSFKIRTYDADGNSSVPVELNCKTYGENYRGSMYNRVIDQAIAQDSKVTIEWGVADISNGMTITELKYTNISGIEKTIEIDAETNKPSIIEDYKYGSEIRYRSFFLPDTTCIDDFWTAWEKMIPLVYINRSQWEVTADTFEGDQDQNPVQDENGRWHYRGGQSDGGGGEPWRVIDGEILNIGDPIAPVRTYWHTRHTAPGATPYPHWLAVDMKRPVLIQYVIIQSRDDVNSHNILFFNFTIQGSNNGTDWTDLETYDVYSRFDVSPQRYPVETETYYTNFRLVMLRGENEHCHLAELSVLGLEKN